MSEAASITVRVPLAIRRRPGRKTVVTPVSRQGGTVMQSHAYPALVKALARAHRWQRLLEEGRFASVQELAEAERVSLSYISRILRLTMLAPDIVERILDGRATVGLARFLKPFPVEWERQRERFTPSGAEPSRTAMT